MTYDEAMTALNDAAYAAVRAANKERKPVTALREMAADIDHLIDHGCTREEMRNRKITERRVRDAGLVR